MSLKHIVEAFGAKVGNASRKLVLLKLADNANDAGQCFPSYQHIADQCEISKRSAVDHIRALESAGYLTIIRRKSEHDDTRNATNIYLLHISKGIPVEAKKSGGGANSALGGGANSAPGVVQILHQGGEPVAPGGGANSAPRISHSFESPIEPKDHTHNAGEREDDFWNHPFELDTKNPDVQAGHIPKAITTDSTGMVTFPMTATWGDLEALAKRAEDTVVLPPISTECLEFHLAEYRNYWIDRPGRQQTENQWRGGLINQLLRAHRNNTLFTSLANRQEPSHAIRQPSNRKNWDIDHESTDWLTGAEGSSDCGTG